MSAADSTRPPSSGTATFHASSSRTYNNIRVKDRGGECHMQCEDNG